MSPVSRSCAVGILGVSMPRGPCPRTRSEKHDGRTGCMSLEQEAAMSGHRVRNGDGGHHITRPTPHCTLRDGGHHTILPTSQSHRRGHRGLPSSRHLLPRLRVIASFPTWGGMVLTAIRHWRKGHHKQSSLPFALSVSSPTTLFPHDTTHTRHDGIISIQ